MQGGEGTRSGQLLGRSICLCMIVKNEAAVIERCLRSARPLIDTWVICDTGSSDGTQDLVRAALVDVPGELYDRPWRNFGENRTELMRLAAGRADYLLLLDADMTIAFEPRAARGLWADAYMLRHAEPTEYWIKRLVRGDRDWRYVGVTHEYLTADGPETVERCEAIAVHHDADGGSRADKFTRDLELLREALAKDPHDARSLFYLAQTHRDLGQHAQAISLYEQRAQMEGWEEETFYAQFQAGVLRAEAGDWPGGLAGMIAAWERRPSRMEPLYELASRLRQRQEYESAFVFAARGLGRPPPPDMLFVSPWVYRWGLLFEYSIAAYWVGRAPAALAACDRLLRMSDLPEAYRKQTTLNRQHCLRRVRAQRRSVPRTSSSTTSTAGRDPRRGQRATG